MNIKSLKEVNLTDRELEDAEVIFNNFWKEDIDVRQTSLAKWRRLKFFWNNISNTWYDSEAHDWRIYDADNLAGGTSNESGQDYYDNRINVFRAYLESIIADLSVTVPPVKCYPDDAELSIDIETAKAGDKIAELIYRHNDVTLLWLHSLYVYMTEGFVASHVSADLDMEHGSYEVEKYSEIDELHDVVSCPSCGYEISNQVVPADQINPSTSMVENSAGMEGLQSEQEGLDFSGLENSPVNGPVPINGMEQMMGEVCPSCNEVMVPEINRVNETKRVWISSTTEPKGRVKLDAYGGLNIKIPLYARTQKECLYLYYSFEEHYAQTIEKYPDLYDCFRGKGKGANTGYDSWEQWARLNPEYRTGSYPVDNVTNKTGWFRPACYNILDKERQRHWKRKFPHGIALTFVNQEFACAREQKLDEHWTLTINPLMDFLQNDPMGMLLVSVQEITNDLISLTKQTIEHGVGLTFVDPAFIDLNAYGQTEVLPGSLIPTKTISGNRKLQDGIYEAKTASLSSEVMPFGDQIQMLGQLASGANPAIYGDMNSATASQDSMAKNQAMARLGNIWKMFGIWWKNTFGKAIPLYIELIQVDERDVKRRKDGSFVNVMIRKIDLSGKIGKVELEANENIPLTWSQRKDIVMQLLLSPNPQIIQMLLAPENLDVLREAIGINGFYVIGEDDRDKQYSEIQGLLESEPIETGDMMNPMVSSMQIDELLDNHVIQFEICRKWGVSEAGQLAKIENPAGYENVLLHAKEHLLALQTPAAPIDPNATQEPGAEPVEKPELSNKNAPINSE